MATGTQDPALSPTNSTVSRGRSITFSPSELVVVSEADLLTVGMHSEADQEQQVKLRDQASELRRLQSNPEDSKTPALGKKWKALQRSVQLNKMLQDDVEEMRSMVGSIFQGDPFEIEMEEAEDGTTVDKWVLPPDSRFRILWDFVQVPMLLYVSPNQRSFCCSLCSDL